MYLTDKISCYLSPLFVGLTSMTTLTFDVNNIKPDVSLLPYLKYKCNLKGSAFVAT